MTANPGTVLNLRHLATSDHEPVWLGCKTSLPPTRPRKPHENTVAEILDSWPHSSGDPLQQIAEVAAAITKPGRGIKGFRESQELRLLRQARRQWKEVLKLRRQEHSRWKTDMFDKAGRGFWHSKKTVDRDGHTSAWELRLQDDESWRQTLVQHFEGIFKCRPRAEVDLRFRAILENLTKACKHSPWQPFRDDELRAVRKRWKNGKSCGLDAISREALKILLDNDYWQGKLRELFSDMLYVGKLQEAVERGITVLLAKGQAPKDWGETRPITLSSTLLKTYSQLIIHRAAHLVQEPARLQWSRRHRQGVELILMLRKVCRTSHDWGIPMYIAKLDIRKAFDSIYQESLAEQIATDVGGSGGRPWEARSWVTLLHAKEIRIFFRDETFIIDQTNGVRQGSPDSPIAFGRIVAKELDASIREASAAKDMTGDPPPEDGCCYMDDSYIWSSSRRHLQAMLDRLGANLPPRGLYIHPGKTDIIDNQVGGVEFQVGGNTVMSKGPKHVIRALGSPLCFAGSPSILIAEMQARGRRAFSKHHGTLMANAPLKGRLKLHTTLVRQSALWACQTWPCIACILKAANALQLLHARTLLKHPRQSGEPWEAWHIRSMRKARVMLFRYKIERWSTFILRQIWSLLGLVARGDEVVSNMLRWRDLAWWRVEQSIPSSWGGNRHAQRFHPMLDIERQVCQIAGEQWQLMAQNRTRWALLEDNFVEKFDVPWSSGNQIQLDNLAPNTATKNDIRRTVQARRHKSLRDEHQRGE